MTSDGIVESRDVIEHICSGLVSCPICFAAGTLGLLPAHAQLYYESLFCIR